MRDFVTVFVVTYFYCTAVIIAVGLFSRTLMETESEGFKITYGMWELCKIPLSNNKHSDCSGFNWQEEVKSSVAADRVRAILAFGTMTFIGAVLIVTSPCWFPLFLCGKISSKLMRYCFLGTTIYTFTMGCITWIIMSVCFHDVIVDDYPSTSYGWGAYVFRVGVGMTSLCVPVTFVSAFYRENAVGPEKSSVKPQPPRGGDARVLLES